MNFMYPGLKETTAGEYKILGCLFFVAPVITGLVLIYFGYNASDDKKALGNFAVNIGWLAIIVPVDILIIWKLIRKFILK